jgi:integrase
MNRFPLSRCASTTQIVRAPRNRRLRRSPSSNRLRRAELERLDWSEIDFESGLIEVTATESAGVVAVAAEAQGKRDTRTRFSAIV